MNYLLEMNFQFRSIILHDLPHFKGIYFEILVNHVDQVQCLDFQRLEKRMAVLAVGIKTGYGDRVYGKHCSIDMQRAWPRLFIIIFFILTLLSEHVILFL
jgi:membrane-anchored protein YejM (alkaline phosphatase superfamily)